jgi:SAM-dependent methyltransferase
MTTPGHDSHPDPSFGAGGTEPYANALLGDGQLHLVSESVRDSAAPASYNLQKWTSEADLTDRALLAGETGPVLDIGCGPGRMLRAADDLGFCALGIDVSPTAVALARASGLPVVRRSVFDTVPREGEWGTALLLDGNIGIGGDPMTLLHRCRQLIAETGAIVIEVHTDSAADQCFSARVQDEHGGQSEAFPWAEIGRDALRRYADAAKLHLVRTWSSDGRTFCRLVPTRRECGRQGLKR